VVIDVPSVSGGAVVLARFCRELAREASRIASDLDPGQAITTGCRAVALREVEEMPHSCPPVSGWMEPPCAAGFSATTS
jgi:hypothetical protein